MLINRDLSWLAFNNLVLEQAAKVDLPLYERLRFLAIFSSNLDEFFRIRYPALVAFSRLDKKTIRKEALISQSDLSDKIQGRINEQLSLFGKILLTDILPSLQKNNIVFYYNTRIRNEHTREIREIFLSQVLSFIQPIILGSETSYDFMPENNQLYLVVTLKDPVKDTVRHTIVNIPAKKLQRFYVLSPIDNVNHVIFIDDIVRENISMIFPGQHVQGVYSIKFNRDAELEQMDEYSINLLEKLEKQLTKRDYGAATRFLYEKGMPSNVQIFLASLFNVALSDMFEGGRYHNLSDLFTFPSFSADLHFPNFKPISYPLSASNGDIFNTVIDRDVLLHLPYHSYAPVLSFFNQAAVDPDVTHIYITLYRVASESHIVNALISAAKNGKKVTAFIELKARFDEANNIKWSRMMKQAGINIIYSDPKIKVHSKIAIVHKKINGRDVSFAVLSTGNFNESTALFYTDHVLFTVKKDIVKELMQLFEFLQKKNPSPGSKKVHFKELLVSRFNMLDDLERLVNREIRKAKKGLPALIRIKVNNLEEPWFINLLYKASQSGVRVNLIVRSVCCIEPGVAGLSDNITVKRIVDRFLEHTRLFMFGTEENLVVAIGSSDLMTRNLRHRIEVCAIVQQENCRTEIEDYFEIQWRDNTNAVLMKSGATYEKIEPKENEPLTNAQKEIYRYLENKP